MRWALVDSWRADSLCLRMARSRNYPMLQKSPSGLCEIEICNYRIGAPVLLNRCCAFQPDLESIFLAEMLKILLQHNLPVPDSCGAANYHAYSITSSASDIRLSEILRPSVFAVLRLMTTSNLVGSWTGRSAGFAPLRIRSIYDAARRKRSAVLLPKDSKPPLSAK